ncbi:MAG: endonuclease MutS2 [Oscillospiraceae bacterium]
MTDRFQKSMNTLELPKVLALLSDQAVTEEGKNRALLLAPSTDREEVRRRLAETSAAFRLLTLKGTPSLSGVRPVGAALQRADRGGTLNTRELLDIAGVLQCARNAKEYGEGADGGVIDHFFRSLTPNKFLEEKITGTIVGEDEISDSASTLLADIRRHMRATASKVRDILNKLIASNQSKYLQESIITMRSDRYVVPVKAEHKNEVPGLVHDVSGSGGTFFIEPMGVVKANNELRELQADEKKEIERILAELSAEAANFKEDISQDYDMLVLLDGIFARAKLSSKMNGMEPKITENKLLLRRARHPLLDPKTAVANDLMLGGDFDTLVITGPNTGGKTVTLKTLGLLTLMAQCGLHIPAADGSEVAIFSSVLADVGDEQSIAQSLSTFSSHMTNIVGILEEADSNSLVLFDELGAGTDPIEGAALAAAIIEESRKRGALVAATTHYAELKVYAMTTPGVENASCEFDVETLAPTYKLLIGIPGKSNAFAISKRLGLSDAVIEKAAERVTAENVRFEDVLTQLDVQRQAMEREKLAAAKLRLEMEQSAKVAGEYRARIEEERAKAREKANAEARQILDDARRAADETFAELNKMRRQQQKNADFQEMNDTRTGLRHRLNEAENALDKAPEIPVPPMVRPAVVGDTVQLVSMGTQATVLSVNKDGALQLQAGILKISAKQEEVRVVEGETQSQKDAKKFIAHTEHKLRSLGASPELDLRGMMADEAERAVDLFLDNAMMGNLETVRIIHGKGTGALRKAVGIKLKSCKTVKSFRLGGYGEGDNGVTIVTLK